MTVSIGLEQLLTDPAAWVQPDRRVGLLTNPTGVDRRLVSTVDLLHAHPVIRLTRLYGPEHGIRGDAQAGAPVDDAVDARTGLPVTSLYRADHLPAAAAFDDIDTLLIDLQDIGTRFYTYLASANDAARHAASAGAEVLVLDRPNPIAWMGVSGNRVAPGSASLVGIDGMPITHGATIGELLGWLARRDGRTPPQVVPLRGWDRQTRWPHTGLPWVPPSPNIPTLDTATVYPATCPIEGTTLSEGRGTALPFLQFGAPELDGDALAARLNGLGIDGYRFRPTTFVPTFSKHAGERCRGVQVHPLGDPGPAILRLGPPLLATLRDIGGDRFGWVESDEAPFVDRLAGGPELREVLERGDDLAPLLKRWDREAEQYVDAIAPHLRYGPLSVTEMHA